LSRSNETITLSIKPGDGEKLKELAISLGFKWGEKANISKMLSAIALGDLQLVAPNIPLPEGYTPTQMAALTKAIQHFASIQDFDSVAAIASILSARPS
jgi:hypothetical protein